MPGVKAGAAGGPGAGVLSDVEVLRSLHDVLTAVHLGRDLEDVLQRVAQGVVDVLGFEVAAISYLNAGDELETLAVAGSQDAADALMGARVPVAEIEAELRLAEDWGLLRFLPHDRLPASASEGWVPDVELSDREDAWHPLDTLYALLNGPGEDLVGILCVDLPVDRLRPGPRAREALELYAAQAGLALHDARERSRLRERVRLSAAMRKVVQAATREPDLERMVDSCVAALAEGLRADRVTFRIFDAPGEEPGGQRLAREGRTFPVDLFDHLPGLLQGPDSTLVVRTSALLLEVGRRVAHQAWRESRTVVSTLGDGGSPWLVGVLDAAERDEVAAFLARHGAASLLLIPCGSGASCLGYILLMRLDPGAWWTEAEREAAAQVGREIGHLLHGNRLYEQERQLARELQELDRYKAESVRTVTHELKNPLAAIAGHAELLEDSGEAPVSVAAISRNVRRLQRLVDDLLLLGNVQEGQQGFDPVVLDLGKLVEEAVEAVSVQATRQGLRLDLGRVAGGVPVLGEPKQVLRMLVNIVGNAVKYTPHGGAVTLTASTAGEYAEFTCTDTGIGIAPADLDTLFDEFDRGSDPRAHAVPGTGLGLSIVRRIVERHQGRIEVDSAPGSGSTFRVVLPAPVPARILLPA